VRCNLPTPNVSVPVQRGSGQPPATATVVCQNSYNGKYRIPRVPKRQKAVLTRRENRKKKIGWAKKSRCRLASVHKKRTPSEIRWWFHDSSMLGKEKRRKRPLMGRALTDAGHYHGEIQNSLEKKAERHRDDTKKAKMIAGANEKKRKVPERRPSWASRRGLQYPQR